MSKTFIDKACAVVPEFENRIYRFDKKLRIAQYAEHSIYDYKLKIAQAALYLQKLPDDFTQDDIEGYLSSLLDQKRYSISFFKHTVFGLQNYYKVMGLKQPRGLVLPKVRKPKKLPRVLSQRSIARLLKSCGLYDKALLAYIARYAYRVAITNSRILEVTDNEISYDYKDYRKGGKHGVMTMDIDGFLNLLSQHILPDRFVRIRHYGILSPACREILRCIQQQLNVPPVPKERKKKSYLDICNEKGWEIGVCKDCNCKRIIVSIIDPAPRAPPFRIWRMGN